MSTLQNLPTRVNLVDVGPLDGLQNEKQMVPAAVNIELSRSMAAKIKTAMDRIWGVA